ncbi:nuclear transport factor 2 family protein [Mangrovimicrobium sediminis]|uniref:Nuclear transport factor 2 family protein n=1 Tax=Mangrovimicrobium sediminis TaxID=2562682 RepID=A0A4Z0LVK0_9GAMM|nr:nuclear transport factor 2 family protein [Haliea sp. SAOS-164]TGD71300.1 nuclear transport factor 2 family protein [Haliea sp. SAOS-164]
MSDDLHTVILAREQQRCDALLAGDIEALSGLLSERLVFAHANTNYDDKASLLARMSSGNIVYNTLRISEPRVVDLGDTALLVSRLTAGVTVGGQDKAIDNWTLSVWTQEAGEWRLVAYQPTAIPG